MIDKNTVSKNGYIELAQKLSEQIISARRRIHKNPEFGMDLPRTCAFVRERLEAMGYQVSNCGGGLTCTVGHGKKTILLRADMDALKIAEDNDLPFKSVNGLGHLCGHDAHTAMLLGAAAILKKKEESLCGTVKFMFQPGEEVMQGAKSMVEAGVLENPKVDAALAIHVMSHVENGRVTFHKEYATSSIDLFKINVTGRGGHGSAPELTRDPLYTVTQIYQNLNGLIARESSMFDRAVLSIGVLGGGTMANIIPESARLEGTLRCYNKATRDRIVACLEKTVKNICEMTGTDYQMELDSTAAVYNDPQLCEQVGVYLKDLLGDQFIEETLPLSGSEDFSVISEYVPAMYMLMGVGHEGARAVHDPKAIFEEDRLYLGSAALAYGAAKWLEEESKK